MNKSMLAMILAAVFCLSALATLALSVRYVWLVRDLGQLQVKAAVAQRDRAVVNAIVADAVEYGKRNPAIQPLLKSVGVRFGETNAPAARPTK